MKNVLPDNGGRRLGNDRREFFYTAHIPERRSGKERRSGFDRRLKPRTSKWSIYRTDKAFIKGCNHNDWNI